MSKLPALGIEPGIFHVLAKFSTTDLCSQPLKTMICWLISKCAFGILIVPFMRDGCIMHRQLALHSRKSSCLCTMSVETKGVSQMDKFHRWGTVALRDPVLGWKPRPRVRSESKCTQKPAQSGRWLCTL